MYFWEKLVCFGLIWFDWVLLVIGGWMIKLCRKIGEILGQELEVYDIG
jgi:hypothetical protein